jgi:acetylornithine deacetylase
VTRWRITTTGQAAHSAYPERGENAIYLMGHVLVRMEEYAQRLRTATPYGILGTPTASVGVIEGGQAVNIVPDRCWIEVDRRTVPGEHTGQVLDDVRALLADIPHVTLEVPHIDVPGMDVPPESPIVRLLQGGITSVLGQAHVETANYATDAGVYNSHGIPTVVFGPGDIAQAHTSSEFVELNQVRQAVEILQRIL